MPLEILEETVKSSGNSHTCQSCGQPNQSMMPQQSAYIYAIGRIEGRFRSQGLEKEYMQVAGRSGTDGLTDRQALHRVISQRENRYIARQLCWVFTVEGIETYILTPRDPVDLDLLIEALRPNPARTDIDVVIGTRGPVAPPEMCNGLTIPVVIFDQVYSFSYETLLDSMPRPKDKDAEKFKLAAAEMLDRVMDMAENTGSSDAHRAINYLTVRYPPVYARLAQSFDQNFSLAGVEILPSKLSGPRKILDLIFNFVSRVTDVREKYFVRVDVSEEFPFLVTKLSPYFDI